MRNYPKVLQTKEDYEYVRTNFPKEKWMGDFQSLLDTQYEWFLIKELASDEAEISDRLNMSRKPLDLSMGIAA